MLHHLVNFSFNSIFLIVFPKMNQIYIKTNKKNPIKLYQIQIKVLLCVAKFCLQCHYYLLLMLDYKELHISLLCYLCFMKEISLLTLIFLW